MEQLSIIQKYVKISGLVILKNNFKEIITLPDNILLLVQHLLLTNRLKKGYYELRKYSAKHRKYLRKRVLAE